MQSPLALDTAPSGQFLNRQSSAIREGASSAVNVASTEPPKIENLPPTLGSTCAKAPGPVTDTLFWLLSHMCLTALSLSKQPKHAHSLETSHRSYMYALLQKSTYSTATSVFTCNSLGMRSCTHKVDIVAQIYYMYPYMDTLHMHCS